MLISRSRFRSLNSYSITAKTGLKIKMMVIRLICQKVNRLKDQRALAWQVCVKRKNHAMKLSNASSFEFYIQQYILKNNY